MRFGLKRRTLKSDDREVEMGSFLLKVGESTSFKYVLKGNSKKEMRSVEDIWVNYLAYSLAS